MVLPVESMRLFLRWKPVHHRRETFLPTAKNYHPRLRRFLRLAMKLHLLLRLSHLPNSIRTKLRFQTARAWRERRSAVTTVQTLGPVCPTRLFLPVATRRPANRSSKERPNAETEAPSSTATNRLYVR